MSIRLHKDELLQSLHSDKTIYKRVTLSPIRFAGGKSLAVGHIIEAIPEGVTRVISPFLGGGSVEVALNQKLHIEIIGSDILKPLVTYWQQQIENPTGLYKRLSALSPTPGTYAEIKRRLKYYWDGLDCGMSSDQELAMMYYFNHNLSYGPSFLGWMSKIYQDPVRYKRIIEKVRDFRPGAQFFVTCNSFELMFERHKKQFFYCDPPYMLKEECPSSKMFTGIYPQRNFPVHHKGFSHEKLHECVMNHEGAVVLSYNDCDKVRDMYKDCTIKPLSWQYTMGQGETRVSHNRQGGNHVKKSHELLIIKE